MATEAILKELFQVAKGSRQFKGISDSDIWKACLSYNDRPDEHIRIAMENIQKKDQAFEAEEQEKQEKLEKGKKKVMALHQQEAGDRQKDSQNAEGILADLFS